MNMSNIKAYSAYDTKDISKSNKKNSDYGKTIGEPKLSDEAKKYYEKLKEKYSNMEFILVDTDFKEQAQAHATSYANPTKTVVLIDEEKIERMAVDEEYRKKYEGILSGATAKLAQMQEGLASTGTEVKGFGIQVNDDGTASYFAVLQKASDNQKARIEAKAEEKREAKRAEKKQAQKEEAKERLERERSAKADENGETTIIKANSLEELLQKIKDYAYTERGNAVRTEAELMVGQKLDIQV